MNMKMLRKQKLLFSTENYVNIESPSKSKSKASQTNLWNFLFEYFVAHRIDFLPQLIHGEIVVEVQLLLLLLFCCCFLRFKTSHSLGYLEDGTLH